MLITYVIIAILAWIITVLFTAISDKESFSKNRGEAVFASLFAGGAISLGISILVHTFSPFFIPCNTQTETVPLYALTDNYYVDSKACGDGEAVYRYLTESDKGLQIVPKTIKEECVYFAYTDETPYLEINSEHFRHGWWDIVFSDSGEKRTFILFNNEEYIFHIPKDSLSTEIVIDLE